MALLWIIAVIYGSFLAYVGHTVNNLLDLKVLHSSRLFKSVLAPAVWIWIGLDILLGLIVWVVFNHPSGSTKVSLTAIVNYWTQLGEDGWKRKFATWLSNTFLVMS